MQARHLKAYTYGEFPSNTCGSLKMAAMNRKKIDNRIRVLIENGVALRHRSFFVIAGDKGRDQVIYARMEDNVNSRKC